MSHDTTFAGLTELDPGDPITVDGGSFLQKNPSNTDRLLRVGAVTHKHDAHRPLPDPIGFSQGDLAAETDPSGQIPANVTMFAAYTFTDAYGGETRRGAAASAVTPGGMGPPSAAITAAFDQSAGNLPVGQYTYALTLNDRGGGQSTIGPAVFIQRPPGYINGRILLSGLAQELSSDPTQGWQSYNLWRTQDGGNFEVIATGQTSNTFIDDGLICTDASLVPPNTMLGVESNNIATFTLPNLSHEPSLASASAINLYISTDGSFTDPCLYASYPASAAGTPIVVFALNLLPASPPRVSRSVGGASQIDPDTDILDWHWKRPVHDPSELPATGNASADARVALTTPPSIFIWDGAAWNMVSGAGGGGGTGPVLVSLPTFASAQANDQIYVVGDSVFGDGDSAMIQANVGDEGGGSGLIQLIGTRQVASAAVGGSASSYREMRFISGPGVSIAVAQAAPTGGFAAAEAYGATTVTISASGGGGGSGSVGPTGASGAPGPQGPAGSSAVFVASGGTGSAIVGPGLGFVGSGATQVQVSRSGSSAIVTITTPTVAGPTGPAGASGAPGPTGPAGASGAPGPTGPAGASGAPGPTGPTGPQGIQGPPGTGGGGGVTIGVGGSGAVPLVTPIDYLEFVGSGGASAGVTDLGGGSARISISASGAPGTPGLTWQGAWSAANTYAVGDTVLDTAAGSTYRCVVAVTSPTGTSPSSDLTGHWALFTERGTRWFPYNGAGIPPANTFTNEMIGDLAVRNSDGEVFKRVGTPEWADLGFSIRGPAGPSLEVAASGGASALTPEVYLEFAASGGIGLAVQDLTGGSARILIGAASAQMPIIAASAGASPVRPDYYTEYAGSGGVGVAVQNLGGGSARVLIGVAPSSGGGGSGTDPHFSPPGSGLALGSAEVMEFYSGASGATGTGFANIKGEFAASGLSPTTVDLTNGLSGSFSVIGGGGFGTWSEAGGTVTSGAPSIAATGPGAFDAGQVVGKFTSGDTAVVVLCADVANNNYVIGLVRQSNGACRIYKVVGGTVTNMSSSGNFPTVPSPFWVKFSKSGNVYTLTYYASDPNAGNPTAVDTTSWTVSGGDLATFGTGVSGYAGLGGTTVMSATGFAGSSNCSSLVVSPIAAETHHITGSVTQSAAKGGATYTRRFLRDDGTSELAPDVWIGGSASVVRPVVHDFRAGAGIQITGSQTGTPPRSIVTIGAQPPVVAASAGASAVSPDYYTEYAGSGGIGVAVQSMGGGSARVLIGTQPPVVAASAGASAVTPDYYTEYAGSGGVGVAVQNLGGGSARVLVGPAPASPSFYGVKAHSSTGNFAQTTEAQVTLDSVDFDSTGGGTVHTSGDGKFYPNKAGTWQIIVRYIGAAIGGNWVEAHIRKNGSTIADSAGRQPTTQVPKFTIETVVQVNGTTDNIDMSILSDTGGVNTCQMWLTAIFLG